MNQNFLLSSFVYKVASWVEDTDTTDVMFSQIDFNDKDIQNTLVKFNKQTILHEYIFTYVYTTMWDDIRHNPEDYFPDDESIPYKLENLLDDYKLKYIPFSEFININRSENRDDDEIDLLRDWVDDQKESFICAWEYITEEVFYLLFANRRFLMKFHVDLAEFIKVTNLKIENKYLNKSGKIKRAHIPSWVKKAVYCRDKARCVLCNRDLSGILSTDRVLHYDHIVALNINGVNDPTNLQLLCDRCNHYCPKTELK